jgi:DHA1 family bicyclomycin/chloramphenicol resistance-like MFS transporter
MKAENSDKWALAEGGSERGAGFAEFVALIAFMLALTALSIDVMLPALPDIDGAFGLANPNDRQAVVTGYLFGFAGGQLLYGPASDRFGRKPALMAGLVLFVCGALAASAAPDFQLLLLARMAQGLGGAAPRVISVAVVRDLFSGRQMARVMSFAMTVFIFVPVAAPAIGQGILAAGPWRWTFYFVALFGLVIMAWSAARLPETHVSKLHVSKSRRSGEPLGRTAPGLAAALRMTVTTGPTIGYTAASAFMFGCLMSYIGSAQQIFVDVYGLGSKFPLAFGAVASVMAVSSFANTRLVMRYGMRRISHGALMGFIAASAALTALAVAGQPPLLAFCGLIALAFFMFGLIVANFNAIAMEPMGEIAGTAASVVGFLTTAAAAALGAVVGRLFDGSVLPLAAGFTALGLCALLCVVSVEGWRGVRRGE